MSPCVLYEYKAWGAQSGEAGVVGGTLARAQRAARGIRGGAHRHTPCMLPQAAPHGGVHAGWWRSARRVCIQHGRMTAAMAQRLLLAAAGYQHPRYQRNQGRAKYERPL